MAFANGAYIILLISLVLSTTHGSVKKGYGIDLMAFKCGDLDALTNISWWYNWDANLKQIEEKSGCKIDEKYIPLFVPIIWGYNPSWSQDRYSVDDRYDIVLGFNEPNHKSQSNLTAQEAADAWYIVEQEADNKKIASPAAARCGSGCHSASYIDWFDEFFFSLCGNTNRPPCGVDYIATHMYSCKAQQTMRWIDELYEKYQLPIWLTEFACPYATDPQEELDYMASVLPLLEESDQVYKYAWYVHRRAETTSFITEAANLFETGSSKLTALGEFYNNFPANVTPDPPTNPTDPPTNTTTDKPVTDPPVKSYSSGTCRRRKNRK